MLALLSSFQSLQYKFASIQSEYVALQAQSQNASKNNNNNNNCIKLNKPPPWKENEPEIVDFEGYQWKWCEKCFGGSWNRTHITTEHQPGKGRSKNRQRQTPEASSALLATTLTPTSAVVQPQANIAPTQLTTDVTPESSNSILTDFY